MKSRIEDKPPSLDWADDSQSFLKATLVPADLRTTSRVCRSSGSITVKRRASITPNRWPTLRHRCCNALRGNCARTGLRTTVDVIRSSRPRAHRKPRQPARRRVYAAAQQSNAVFGAMLSVLVLRCALYLKPVVAGSRDAVQPRRPRSWSNVRIGLPPLQNNAKASRTPREAGMQLLAVRSRRPMRSTFFEGAAGLGGPNGILDRTPSRSSPLHERMQRWPM